MNNSENLLQIFKISFIVFLTLSIVFLIVAIVMFIKFDIRGIWAMKSGKAVEKAIKEKADESAKSGRFRKKQIYVSEMKSEELNVTDKMGVEKQENAGLKIQTASEQLPEGTNLTTNLNVEDKSVQLGTFVIEKQIIFVHTEQFI